MTLSGYPSSHCSHPSLNHWGTRFTHFALNHALASIVSWPLDGSAFSPKLEYRNLMIRNRICTPFSLLPPHSVQSLDNKSQGSDHSRQTFIPASPFTGLSQLFWFLNKMLPFFTSNTYLSGQPLKGMKQKPCPARNSCSWQK